jgi:hypothetical protein
MSDEIQIQLDERVAGQEASTEPSSSTASTQSLTQDRSFETFADKKSNGRQVSPYSLKFYQSGLRFNDMRQIWRHAASRVPSTRRRVPFEL